MKVLLTLFVTLFISYSLQAQYVVSGKVVDQSGAALVGVNVYIEGTYDGATTDIEGVFSFKTDQEESPVLIASLIGFEKKNIAIQPQKQSLDITLREEINRLNSVIITAGAFNASDENKREVLKSLDVVTTAGSGADIPSALNTLPGTQRVGETGRLFVRGGEGREAKTYIDGMLVHNEYSPSAPNTPGRSRFSPFMFKGVSFSTGGYSAEYGQALSSALILNSKDVAENNRTDLSLMTVGTDISTTQAFDKGSFAGKLQYTNLRPYFELVEQNLNWDKSPESVNGNFVYRQKVGETGLLKLYSNFSMSQMRFDDHSIGNPEETLSVSLSNDYAYFNASYKQFVSDKVGLRTGLSITKSVDEMPRGDRGTKQYVDGFHTKVVADYEFSDRLFFVFGGEAFGRNLNSTLQSESVFEQAVEERIGAGFGEAEYLLSKKLALKVGLRTEYANLTSEWNIDPRLSAAYKTGEYSQVSLAYGRFHQLSSDQVVLSDPQSAQEQASHYIINYQWIKEGRTFRTEAYEKQYQQLAKYDNIYDASTFSFNGDGYARGVDVFWRDSKTFRGLDYWVSYSYLDSKRDYQNYPGAYTPSFASAHNFSVVAKKFLESIKTQFGATYSYASPRTYNDPNSGQFLSGRTPDFHQLSMSCSYLINNQIILHFSMENVLGRNNVFGYQYASEPDQEGVYQRRAITPQAKRFIFLGLFITLSKNKGINQLPNL